jgi:hypothetical protein
MAIFSNQRSILIVSLLILIGVAAPTLAQEPISAEAVNPRYGVASLSPDGQFLALALPTDGGDRVTVIDIGNTANRPVSYPIENAIVTDVIWRGNDALIIRVYVASRSKSPPWIWPIWHSQRQPSPPNKLGINLRQVHE